MTNPEQSPPSNSGNALRRFLEMPWVQRLLAKHKIAIRRAGYASVFVLGALVAWLIWGRHADESPVSPNGQTEIARQGEGPTIWTCSMHPQIQKTGPGQCPICGMDLIPVTPTAGGVRTLVVSPEARALMNIQTTPVERRFVEAEVRMVGKVEFDETRLRQITAWVRGRLDRLYVDYTGVAVNKGDHLVYIYSEELYSAQAELIQAIRYAEERGTRPDVTGIDLVESARTKLRLLGLTEEQVQEIESRGEPSDHLTIYSPASGIVVEKLRQEGDRVSVGDRIYTVADLSQVWVMLDAYESDLAWLRYGQNISFTTEAFPADEFIGRIAFIDPVLDDVTRTVSVRVNVDNPEGKLRPGMFVRGLVRARLAAGGQVVDPELAGKWISPMHPEIVKDEPGTCDICGMPLVRAETLGYVSPDAGQEPPLVIPASAALITGRRAIVYVELPEESEPTFEGREIVLGPRAGDYYLVRHGLEEGEFVVTNGNFKIDSEVQIQAKPSMMTPEGGGGGGHAHGGHGAGEGSRPQAAGEHEESGIPSAVAHQLAQLDLAYQAVREEMEEGELPAIRAAFARLGDAREAVAGQQLTGHAAMQWREYSMLLGNDVFEGREVQEMEDAQRVFELTQRHMQRLRESLPVQHGDHEAMQPALATREPPENRYVVPSAFQDQLSELWTGYLSLQAALAGDDLPAARQVLPALRESLTAVDTSLLEGATSAAWEKERVNLNSILESFGNDSDLESLRGTFATFSDELSYLAKSFGLDEFGPIYELHCPMAFEGRGAIWLQDSSETSNPYFGAAMLRCADRVEQIVPVESGVHGPDEHHP